MIEHHGPVYGVRCFRKHFAWYAEDLADDAVWCARVNRLDGEGEARATIAEAFDTTLERMAA